MNKYGSVYKHYTYLMIIIQRLVKLVIYVIEKSDKCEKSVFAIALNMN